MNDDLWFPISSGFSLGVVFCILSSSFQEHNRKVGCEQAVNEDCVEVGYVSKSQAEELKKMQMREVSNGN